VAAPQEISEHFIWTAAGFLAQLVTMYETWIHLYDPETKEQSKKWRHSGSLVKKSFEHINQPPR